MKNILRVIIIFLVISFVTEVCLGGGPINVAIALIGLVWIDVLDIKDKLK